MAKTNRPQPDEPTAGNQREKHMYDADLDIIKELELFSQLTTEEIDEIAPLIYVMPVLEGERLIREGEAATRFYISLSGSFMLHDAGGKAVTIHDRGHIIGESAVSGVPAAYHPVTATALTDGAVLVIPWTEVQPVMERYFESDQKIVSMIKMLADAGQAVFHETSAA